MGSSSDDSYHAAYAGSELSLRSDVSSTLKICETLRVHEISETLWQERRFESSDDLHGHFEAYFSQGKEEVGVI